MTQSRNAALVGIVGLVSLGLLAAGCGGGGGTTTGKGGAGGSTGAGGTGTGQGGSGTGQGGADAGPVVGCPASDAPPSMLIADFASADAALSVMGGISAYPSPSTPATPTYTTTTGKLVITENVAATSAPQYVGVVIYFNGNAMGNDCLNGGAYQGVKFDLSGSVVGCSVQYSTNDSAHGTAGGGDAKASGPAGAYPPQATLTTAQITTAVQTIMMPFTGTGAPSGGSPAAAIDPMKLTGVQWQFTIPMAASGDGGATDGGAAGCNATLNIDNVTFY